MLTQFVQPEASDAEAADGVVVLVPQGDPAERHQPAVGHVGHGDVEVLQEGTVAGQLQQHLVAALGVQPEVRQARQAPKARLQEGLTLGVDAAAEPDLGKERAEVEASHVWLREALQRLEETLVAAVLPDGDGDRLDDAGHDGLQDGARQLAGQAAESVLVPLLLELEAGAGGGAEVAEVLQARLLQSEDGAIARHNFLMRSLAYSGRFAN